MSIEEKESPYMGIVLTPDLKTRIKQLAEEEDRTMSAVIRVLLAEALKFRDTKKDTKKRRKAA